MGALFRHPGPSSTRRRAPGHQEPSPKNSVPARSQKHRSRQTQSPDLGDKDALNKVGDDGMTRSPWGTRTTTGRATSVCLKAQRGIGRPGPQPTQVSLSSTDLLFQKRRQRPRWAGPGRSHSVPSAHQSLASVIWRQWDSTPAWHYWRITASEGGETAFAIFSFYDIGTHFLPNKSDGNTPQPTARARPL